VLFSGSAPLSGTLVQDLRKRLPNLKFITQGVIITKIKLIIIKGYGMTECSLAATFPHLFDDHKHPGNGGVLGANFEMKVNK
jgi:acyl-CoA synthetase (AMP-forming)/AMP-acid ligase II